jgi:hypothetical protein
MIGKKFDSEKPDIIQFFELLRINKNKFYPKKIKRLKVNYDFLDHTLIPNKCLNEILKVLEYGAIKYGRNNWEFVKPFKLRYFGALLRHLYQWFVLKEKKDRETGLSHLAHSACCILFLLDKDLK